RPCNPRGPKGGSGPCRRRVEPEGEVAGSGAAIDRLLDPPFMTRRALIAVGQTSDIAGTGLPQRRPVCRAFTHRTRLGDDRERAQYARILHRTTDAFFG